MDTNDNKGRNQNMGNVPAGEMRKKATPDQDTDMQASADGGVDMTLDEDSDEENS